MPSNLGGQFATLGANVPAFISNLGPICNPKVLKVGPKFFWVLTPSVKRALNAIQTTNSLVTFFFLLLHLGTKPVMLYYYN
jgi:hypothetical protein